ncbi:MAG TPA: hypothetical protein VLT16_13910 [Candidatus Limnocylindrales bacterium]|nr:hypothetical protein [Candidatus Limnocylindrales bacterium]
MSRAFSFVTLLIVLAAGAWYYMRQTQGVMSAGSGNPTATVDLIGVRSDLLAIAQAERSHAALKGGYVSLEQLRSDGDLTMTRDSRGPYTYSADVSDSSFRVVATYKGPEDSAMPRSLSIDSTMEISQQ